MPKTTFFETNIISPIQTFIDNDTLNFRHKKMLKPDINITTDSPQSECKNQAHHTPKINQEPAQKKIESCANPPIQHDIFAHL